jgi:Domain of Unknown Function (DUF1206)
VSVRNDTAAAAGQARNAGQGFVHSRLFAILSRAGFVARGLVYGIIGVLALDLALGHGGRITNQQGALHSIEQQSFGHVLLAAVAVGLGGYSLWRLFRATLGHGPEGADRGLDRIGALGSGIAYGLICAVAVEILTRSSGGTSGNGKRTANDAFGWPGGRLLVGIAGLVMLGVAMYQLIRGVRQKFLDDSNTQKMSPAVEAWFTAVGTIGHLARAVVFGLVGIFLIKASLDYKADEAVGLDGALAKLYDGAYGSWLLGAIAAGLVAFAAFSITEARYRRI